MPSPETCPNRLSATSGIAQKSSRKRTSGPAIVALLISALLVITLVPGAAGSEPDANRGLGEYGDEGPIDRSLLPDGVAERVSDRAIELAQSPELATARASWDSEIDFVGQIHYQLTFRSEFGYQAPDASNLGTLLSVRPSNFGIESLGLYLSDVEAAEFTRRGVLNDRIEDVLAALGESDSSVEGEDPDYGPNFAGVWQDHKDAGVIVVALVDPNLIDQQHMAQLVGGDENLRVVDVDYSWTQVEAFRDVLRDALRDGGVQAEVLINSTSRGRELEVVAPNPELITPSILSVVPAELVSVTQGSLYAAAASPSSAHPESEQQPGLSIVVEPNFGCTWGANGHTDSLSVLVTAGHCSNDYYTNYSGWTDGSDIYQAGTFLLTPGSRHLRSIHTVDFDMKRMSSPQADSNATTLPQAVIVTSSGGPSIIRGRLAIRCVRPWARRICTYAGKSWKRTSSR